MFLIFLYSKYSLQISTFIQRRFQNPVKYLRWSSSGKIVDGFQPWTIFAKSFILDVRQGFEYASIHSICKKIWSSKARCEPILGQYFIIKLLLRWLLIRLSEIENKLKTYSCFDILTNFWTVKFSDYSCCLVLE